MKHFLVIYNQGGGCDYTIGCGIRTERIDATDMEAAKRLVYDQIQEEHPSDSEMGIDTCVIFEVTDIFTVDVDSVYQKIDMEKIVLEQARKEAEEREEYKRLKAKFG
jgi:hypothetical protein